MKISIGAILVIFTWLFIAQGCMQFRISDSKAIEQFKQAGVVLKTVTVQTGKNNLHYTQTGHDSLPTILFVHGSPGSWSAFADYMKDKELLQKFRMISVDRPGFGYSDYGNAVRLEKQSALISHLFRYWKNGRPFYLVGHSLGGPLIIRLFADNPGTIDALVLLAASVDPSEEKKERWRNMIDGPVIRNFIPGAFRPSNRELYYFKKDVIGLQDRFPAVTCKVLIVHGTADNFVPPGNASYAVKKLVNASSVDTVFIPGANHFIPWQHFETIKKVLMSLY